MWEDRGPSLHEDPSISQTVGSIYSVHIINGTSAVNNSSWPKEGVGTEDALRDEVSKSRTRGCGQQRGHPDSIFRGQKGCLEPVRLPSGPQKLPGALPALEVRRAVLCPEHFSVTWKPLEGKCWDRLLLSMCPQGIRHLWLFPSCTAHIKVTS